MREHPNARRQRLAYEKTLYRYSTALERGDFDTIIAILHEAENDASLEHLLLEMHQEGYQQEEPIMNQEPQVVSPQSDTPSPQPLQRSQISPRRARKPVKRWLVALQGIAAALVVIMLIVSALFIFTAFGQKQNTANTTVKTRDILVIAGVTNGKSATDTGFVTAMDAHTGARLWQYKFGQNVNINGKVGLVIQNHVVYFASNKQVLALQASDGKLLWKTSLGPKDQTINVDGNSPQLFVDQGRVYASGYSDGILYTLDAKTGKVLWHYDASVPPLLTVSNGIAYVMASENSIKALNGKDGHEIWTYDVQSMSLSATVAQNVLYVQAAHSLEDDPTGFQKDQKPLIALNASTGKQIWSVIAPANAPSELVVAQGTVVLFDGNHFCGYRASNGQQAWCTTGPNNMINGADLTSADGTIYGIYNSSFTVKRLQAINPQDGSVYWSKELPEGVTGGLQVIAFGDSLIVPSSKLALSRTNGKDLWRFSTVSDYILTGATGN